MADAKRRRQRARRSLLFHTGMAGVWVSLLLPTLLWWHDSVLWVAGMSLYANVGVHLAGRASARTALNAEENDQSNGRDDG